MKRQVKSQQVSNERTENGFLQLSPKNTPKNSIVVTSNFSSFLTPNGKNQTSLATLTTLASEKYQSELFLSPSIKQRKQTIDSRQSFFPNKRGMLQTICNDIPNQLKNISYKNVTLKQVLGLITNILSEIKIHKSEKALINQIEKILQSQNKFSNIQFIFINSKLKELLCQDILFKRIINQFTCLIDNRLFYKRTKPDSQFVQILVEFYQKLEDLYKKVQEMEFGDLQQSILSARKKLIDKEIEMQNLFASQQKKDSYNQLQQFFKTKFKFNFRVMQSNISTQIQEIEEKSGRFKQIKQNNRFISDKINELLSNVN